MIERVQEQKGDLGIEEKTTGNADAGYFTENEILNNKDNEDFSIVVSTAAEEEPTVKSNFGKNKKVPVAGYEADDFTYNEKRDVYICPEGKELAQITKTPAVERHGSKTHKYRSVSAVCS